MSVGKDRALIAGPVLIISFKLRATVCHIWEKLGRECLKTLVNGDFGFIREVMTHIGTDVSY